MTAVPTHSVSHPHQAVSLLDIKKLFFCHDALTTWAVHEDVLLASAETAHAAEDFIRSRQETAGPYTKIVELPQITSHLLDQL